MSAALPITAFLINSYLWGYCWRSGAEVDAVFMLMQLNLLYCFFKGKEAFVIARNFTPPLATSREYGAFYSLALLVFISYYFSSGLNKAVDIQLSDWFRYDLVQEMRESYRQSFFNAPASIWPLAPFAEPISMFLKLCGVPAAYAMELTIPLVFVWRRLLLLYAMFFIAFHFITWSVGILFFGDIIAWFSLIPVGTLFGKYRQQLRAR